MRFYYPSLVSSLLWVIYCVIAIAVVWLVLRSVRGRKLGWPLALGSAFVVAMLPWLEEWWIAFRFAQLCRKDAGVFVYKVVEVEGFYDSTMRSAYELTKKRGYRFIEHVTEDRNGIERVELASNEEREKALTWYARTNPGKDRSVNRSMVFPWKEKQVIVVFPNGIDAWKVSELEKSTARYHYKSTSSHTPVGHQIKRFENVVIDTQTGEVLGRYTNYHRGAYWFFIGLDRPTISCAETRAGTLKHGSLIYYAVLKPSKAQ